MCHYLSRNEHTCKHFIFSLSSLLQPRSLEPKQPVRPPEQGTEESMTLGWVLVDDNDTELGASGNIAAKIDGLLLSEEDLIAFFDQLTFGSFLSYTIDSALGNKSTLVLTPLFKSIDS